MTINSTVPISSGTKVGFSVADHVARLGAGVDKAYIDGRWVQTTGDDPWQHIHPASGEADFTIARSSSHDVDLAVRAARRAFDDGPWRTMKSRERKLILSPIGDMVRAAERELAELQSLDNGLPITVGSGFRFSGAFAADLFEYHIGWIDKFDGSVPPVYADGANVQMLSIHEPMGVVAAVTPFNAPVMQFAQKIAPALASGCTIVFKPSEYASNVAMFYMRLLEKLDLPPGVVNIVPGDATTSAALFNHPMIDKIAFTGRREVGEIILKAAAPGIKRTQLELGGKSPSIIFDDVKNVAEAAHYATSVVSMGLSGQLCSTQTRALVQRSIYDEFVEESQKQLLNVRIGDSFDPNVTSAPLVNTASVKRVESLIDDAIQEGARHIIGGERVTGLGGENWISPAIFADVDPKMKIARTEVFGPVLSIIPFDDEAEAIRIANDSEYGLSAGVYTQDPGRSIRVARALRTGTVGINGLFVYPPTAAFGGYKTSGIGREGGRQGFQDYLETKTISIPLD